MGYVFQPNVTYLEINSLPNAAILSDTTLRDTELNPFPAIDFSPSELYAAYCDIIIPNIRNTNAGSNHSHGFTLQIKDSTATWRDCLVVPNPSLWTDTSQVTHGDIYLAGTTSIHEYIDNNAVRYTRMYQHSTHSDSYYLYCVRTRLRLYFK